MRNLLLLLLLFCTSCSVIKIEKRKYNKGFYFTTNKKRTTNSFVRKHKHYQFKVNKNLNSFSLKLKKKDSLLNNKANTIFCRNQSKTDECDRIYLMNGKIIKCKIINKSTNSLAYTLCDTLNNEKNILMLSDIHAIKYANGKREVLQKLPPKEVTFTPLPSVQSSDDKVVNEYYNPEKTTKILNVVSGLFLLASFIPDLHMICLLAILTSLISLVVCAQNDLKKEKKIALFFLLFSILFSLGMGFHLALQTIPF